MNLTEQLRATAAQADRERALWGGWKVMTDAADEIERMKKNLRQMLFWHDAVKREFPVVPSPYHIQETRKVAEAEGEKG